MRCVITFIVCLLSLLINGAMCEDCGYGPIQMKDIMDAAYASKAAYTNIKIGDRIPNTGFTVKVIVEKTIKVRVLSPWSLLKNLFLTESVKVVIAESRSTVMVAFRGSTGAFQIWDQLRYITVNIRGIKVSFGDRTVSIASYFLRAFKILDEYIKGESIMEQPGKKYIITGHSLGGAMAALQAIYSAAHEGYLWRNKDSRLITFGEPRVGKKDFAILHDLLIPRERKLRIVNGFDIVAHVPPRRLGYAHHAGGLWMEDNELWEFCGDTETKSSCGNTRYTAKYNMLDHILKLYIRSLTRKPSKFLYCSNGCKRYNNLKDALNSACDSPDNENFRDVYGINI